MIVIRILRFLFLFSGVKSGVNEWPVFFEHLGFVHSLENKWILRFETPTDFHFIKTSLVSLNKKIRELKSSSSISSSFSPGAKVPSLSSLEETMIWMKDNEDYSFKISSLSLRLSNILEMCKSEKVKGRQVSSGVLQSLFGVAYANDVSSVSSRLETIDSQVSDLIKNLRNEQIKNHVNWTSQMSSSRELISTIDNKTQLLERQLQHIERNPLLQSSLGEFVTKRQLAIKEIQKEIQFVEKSLKSFEKFLSSLSEGHLSTHVISPHELKKTLESIESKLPEHFSLLFPPNLSLWPYYSSLPITNHFSNHSIQLSLSVPLMDSQNILDLHKVNNLPLKVQNGYSVTADITTEFLVTDKSRNYYLEFQKEDLKNCQSFSRRETSHYFCELNPLYKADNSLSCVMELYRGHFNTALCQSKIKHGLVSPFMKLTNGSWIFSAVHEKLTVLLQCPDGNTETALVGFGVIHLSDGCSISSIQYKYPKFFRGTSTLSLEYFHDGFVLNNSKNEKELVDQSEQSHVVNSQIQIWPEKYEETSVHYNLLIKLKD